MYPNITLEIKNHIPSLVYYTSENVSKKITLKDENLKKLFSDIATELKLIIKESREENNLVSGLLDLARESDETYIIDYPEIDVSNIEFNLEQAARLFLDNIETVSEYSDIELDDEIREEVNKNQNADIFASLLDYLYTIMAAKALLAGSELGIGNIRLTDEQKNTRLQEKLAIELDKMGVELIVG